MYPPPTPDPHAARVLRLGPDRLQHLSVPVNEVCIVGLLLRDPEPFGCDCDRVGITFRALEERRRLDLPNRGILRGLAGDHRRAGKASPCETGAENSQKSSSAAHAEPPSDPCVPSGFNPSSARFAASCSASFLLGPVASPSVSPLTTTWT